MTTPFSELDKYRDLVYIAENASDFAKCITTALEEDGLDRIAQRRQSVRDVSWESKVDVVLRALFGDNVVSVALPEPVL